MVVEDLETLNHWDDVHTDAIIPLTEVNALHQRAVVVDGAEQRILIDLCHALMNSLLPLVFRYLLFWHSSFKQVRTSKRE